MHLMITVQKQAKIFQIVFNDLKMAITEYVRNVDRSILNTVFDNAVRRVNKCLETGGGQFEHYL
jgi:6-pyruvoyl-tetrahydropterin synthase